MQHDGKAPQHGTDLVVPPGEAITPRPTRTTHREGMPSGDIVMANADIAMLSGSAEKSGLRSQGETSATKKGRTSEPAEASTSGAPATPGSLPAKPREPKRADDKERVKDAWDESSVTDSSTEQQACTNRAHTMRNEQAQTARQTLSGHTRDMTGWQRLDEKASASTTEQTSKLEGDRMDGWAIPWTYMPPIGIVLADREHGSGQGKYQHARTAEGEWELRLNENPITQEQITQARLKWVRETHTPAERGGESATEDENEEQTGDSHESSAVQQGPNNELHARLVVREGVNPKWALLRASGGAGVRAPDGEWIQRGNYKQGRHPASKAAVAETSTRTLVCACGALVDYGAAMHAARAAARTGSRERSDERGTACKIGDACGARGCTRTYHAGQFERKQHERISKLEDGERRLEAWPTHTKTKQTWAYSDSMQATAIETARATLHAALATRKRQKIKSVKYDIRPVHETTTPTHTHGNIGVGDLTPPEDTRGKERP